MRIAEIVKTVASVADPAHMADVAPLPMDDTLELGPPLTREEDDELRSLNYLNEIGCLAPHKAERLLELRVRDRRFKVRPPRGVVEEEERQVAENALPRFLARRRR